jgi:hypothetical protein
MDAVECIMTRRSSARLVEPAPAAGDLDALLKAAAAGPPRGWKPGPPGGGPATGTATRPGQRPEVEARLAVAGGSGAFGPGVEVALLGGCERVDVDAHGGELDLGDFGVDLGGHLVHSDVEFVLT